MNSRTFKLVQDYYTTGKKLYAKKSAKFHPGLTVIVGQNGSGKTTLLKQVRNQLEKANIEYFSFDNLIEGGSNARDEAAFFDDIDFLAQSLLSSEGQNIYLNLSKVAKKIGKYVKQMVNQNQNELWILFDAIDSGLSIDNIVSFKNDLVNTVLETNKGRDVYILVTANEYELARGEDCFDARLCRYRKFADYEDYRSYILNEEKM